MLVAPKPPSASKLNAFALAPHCCDMSVLGSGRDGIGAIVEGVLYA